MNFLVPNEKKFARMIDNITETTNLKNCSKFKMYQRQCLTTLNFLFGLFLFGMSQGHSTVLIEQLETNNTNDFRIENGEWARRPTIFEDDPVVKSWVVSILILCVSPGCWILAAFNRLLGRKKILLISVVLYFISWVTIAMANNVTHIIIGRALTGFSTGIFTGLASVYQGECATPNLRTTLISIHSVSFTVGMGVCHALAIWLHWRTIALIAAFISAIAIFSVSHMTESPIWLLKKEKFSEAIKSWTYLRGIGDLEELKSMHAEKLNDSSKKFREEAGSSITKKYWTPVFWKPFGIMIVFFTVLHVSGMGAVTNYCTQLIRAIAGSKNVHIATLILDVFRTIASILLSVITRRYSSRVLTLFSAYSTTLFLILLSLCTYFEIWTPWSSLVLLFAYTSVVIGLMSLPWTFGSELFSTPYKEVAMSFVSCYSYILFFIVLNRNPFLIEKLDASGTFLFYGILTLTGSFILYLILPDTKNKSLKEIETMFSGNNKEFEKNSSS